jgi:hypothetical protein
MKGNSDIHNDLHKSHCPVESKLDPLRVTAFRATPALIHFELLLGDHSIDKMFTSENDATANNVLSEHNPEKVNLIFIVPVLL